MNALTTTTHESRLQSYANGADPFSSAASDMGASDGNYLKFSGKTGEWMFGKDEDELPEGTRLAVNMLEFKRGWICWNDGEVEEEIMIRVIDGSPPLEHQLTDHGPYQTYDDGTKDGWSAQASVPLTSGEGEAFLYKTSSKSGTRALAGLMKDFGKLFRSHPGQVPLVEIGANSFEPKNAKKGSKAYAPTFKIVDWVDESSLEADDHDDAEDGAASDPSEDPRNYAQAAQAPAAATPEPPKAAAPETEAAGERPAPTGRRAKKF